MSHAIALTLSLLFAWQPASTSERSAVIDRQQVELVDLSPEAFKAEIERGGAQLVDVRTPGEYANGHISGSLNIDWSAPDYERNFARLDHAVPVLLYCQAGGRSEQAKEYLEAKGFKVKHLSEGYAAWQKAGFPTEK